MNSTNFHSAERTSQRRTAVQASIRATRNMGRVWNGVAVVCGLGIAALLSGFALWAPIVSLATVLLSIALAIALAWAGAVLLPKPSAGVLWFAAPIFIGVVCAGLMRQWAGFTVLFACMIIPLLSLALYQADARAAAR